MNYQQNILYYRCASTNFEELHSVTVPAAAKPAEIAANYAEKPDYRLVKLTTSDGTVVHDFERSARNMTVQDRLYEKASAEYNAFISEVKQLPGDQAIERAYEKVIKEDILLTLDACDLPDKEAKALLSMKKPLDAMYRECLDSDCSYMDMIRDTIDDLAQKEIRNQRDVAR